jgi:hypothetical protein
MAEEKPKNPKGAALMLAIVGLSNITIGAVSGTMLSFKLSY